MASLFRIVAAASLIVPSVANVTPLQRRPVDLPHSVGAVRLENRPFATSPTGPVAGRPFGGALPRRGSDPLATVQRGPRDVTAQYTLFGGKIIGEERDPTICRPHKACAEDGTVCTRILDEEEDGQPVLFEYTEDNGNRVLGNYWELTFPTLELPTFWLLQPGNSWCLSLTNYAKMVNRAGCEQVDINCEAMSVDAVMRQNPESSPELNKAKECIKQMCAPPPPAEPAESLTADAPVWSASRMSPLFVAAIAMFAVAVTLARRVSTKPAEPLLA
eukprot:gnl/TRDRNA2_/TRDRNA2_30871_c0_seq1.p1 gnl/TRDRNA2_/TRDRNA2_30871_c0~~gnl/TRDRNA2_/TRDRNA2_30871_c0_seq1.p1  ORF type:complete len:274 (+),score=28.14 gnl/TRDRNA2_/TRDRNA2_30871_c0_seq1:76-897(+)